MSDQMIKVSRTQNTQNTERPDDELTFKVFITPESFWATNGIFAHIKPQKNSALTTFSVFCQKIVRVELSQISSVFASQIIQS